ncbi:hypothetical protein JQK15_19965 [Sphingobium sp. BHU LFT2]|uniref:Rap1a/Tai family immunity protein n=1 Tax=Sphingobium sp. BHU LFT2 TaxID=2807634 RepID=UPI001BE6BEA3|nr:Rap1a/Tai family immunity protein [Sphingobium sp. BHU LFT2]MBT2245794.1 hypothetical protein [Sphingobium sp. BHU LFT2]
MTAVNQFRVIFRLPILSVGLPMSVAWAPPEGRRRDGIFSGLDHIRGLEGRAIDGSAGSEHDRTLSSARANAYIFGVAGATSKRWCGAVTILPHELVDRAYTYLRALPSDRLQEGASSLVADGLAGAFPCRAN